MLRKLVVWCLAAVTIGVVAAGSASAHQTLANNRVTVTLHVNPNDEPLVGEPTTIWVVRVRPLRALFKWKTCSCRLKVFNSDGETLFQGPVKTPRTPFTFPAEGAYGITFSGRVKPTTKSELAKRRMRSFKVTFALRAWTTPPEG